MFHELVGPETLLYPAPACTLKCQQGRNPFEFFSDSLTATHAAAGAAVGSEAGFAGPAFLRPGAIIMII